MSWRRRLSVLVLGNTLAFLCFSTEACGGCHEGTCECADGTEIRVESAPCECRSVCQSHGGVCSDDYAGCPVDAGDAADEASDADAWPWPWDAGG